MSKPQTCLGFDFGLKSIGVAVGQTITRTARGVTALKANNGQPDWAEIDRLIRQWLPQILLVGLPLSESGQDQPMTRAVRGFYKDLAVHYPDFPVEWVDERYTTVSVRDELFAQEGRRSLKKARIDSESAKLICEQWLRAV